MLKKVWICFGLFIGLLALLDLILWPFKLTFSLEFLFSSFVICLFLAAGLLIWTSLVVLKKRYETKGVIAAFFVTIIIAVVAVELFLSALVLMPTYYIDSEGAQHYLVLVNEQSLTEEGRFALLLNDILMQLP